jgi:phytol kinase
MTAVLKVIGVALLYSVFFGSVEIITKKFKLNKESSRKIVHVLAGIAAACLPFFMSFHEIMWLSLLFIPVMLLSKRINFFSSIHDVKRTTYGEVYFPLAILLTALLFPHRVVYIYGLLVMALSDGFASILGQKYGRHTFSLLGSHKSYFGSLVFLIITLVLGIFALHAIGANSVQVIELSVLLAGLLTISEAGLSYGLDNLIIPVLASFLLWWFIRLFSLG